MKSAEENLFRNLNSNIRQPQRISRIVILRQRFQLINLHDHFLDKHFVCFSISGNIFLKFYRRIFFDSNSFAQH